jgi:hypothetical protein
MRKQIIEDYIEKTSLSLKIKADKAFEIFAHTLFLDKSIHSYNPNDNVDGGQDKQIDLISIEEEGEEATIYITQVKNEDTFKSNAIIQLKNGLDWIFNKKKADLNTLINVKFKDKIVEIRDLRTSLGPSNLNIKVAYITKGYGSEISDECLQEANSIIEEYENGTYSSFSFELIGSNELVELLGKQEKRNKKLDIDLKIDYDKNKGSIILYNSKGLKGLICTVTAIEIARAVNYDKHGSIFDLNIRRYLGSKGKGVNNEILSTCTSAFESHLFWFLNNGITITCDKVEYNPDPDNPEVKIKNIQIVNGCQTASTLTSALNDCKLMPDTKVLVRIYETNDLGLVDKIVLTTNNQNVISTRNLRANDKAQTDLKKAFNIYGFYLETKPREFDNSKIDKEKIIPNDLVAVAYLGIALKRPSDARSRKYKVWGEFYQKIFSGNIVEPYILTSVLYRKVFQYLNEGYGDESDNLKRFIAKNASFHISRITAFKWMKGDPWFNHNVQKNLLEKLLKDDSILDNSIEDSFKFLIRIVKSNSIFSDDLNSALKSYELDNEINKRLYKSLTKKPKQVVS